MSEPVKVSTTRERLLEAMRETGKKQTDLARETGLNKSIISRCVKGSVEPSQLTIMRLARALDVQEMWLWGYDTPKERTIEQKKSDQQTKLTMRMRKDDMFAECTALLDKLDDADLRNIHRILSAIVDK